MNKIVLSIVLLALSASAQAQYRSPHWTYDDRYHHRHYYPAVGYSVAVLPPVGVVVPLLPPAYTVVYARGAPYYYANEVYYAAVSGGAGYAVVAPPPGAEPTTDEPAPPPANSPQPAQAPGSAPTASAGTWYYCASAKGYYPYVAECKEGWRPVPAAPPR